MAAINTRLKILISLATTVSFAIAIPTPGNHDSTETGTSIKSEYETLQATAEKCGFPPAWMFITSPSPFERCKNVVEKDTNMLCSLIYGLTREICKTDQTLAMKIAMEVVNYGKLKKPIDQVCSDFQAVLTRHNVTLSNCTNVCSDMRLPCELNYIALKSYDEASVTVSTSASTNTTDGSDKKQASVSGSPNDKISGGGTDPHQGGHTVAADPHQGGPTVAADPHQGGPTVAEVPHQGGPTVAEVPHQGGPTGAEVPHQGGPTKKKPSNTNGGGSQQDEDDLSFESDDKTGGSKGNVYPNREEIEIDGAPSSGNFMAYFLTAVVLCIAGYVVFHNKQKIFAFVIEGRTNRQRRRTNGSGEYKKLQSNVEEVMPSLDKSTSARNFIY